MALFNYANREITAKIVYYGPGGCGKTASLQYIHERISPEQRGRLLSLATETDRTISFDLLPLKLGEVRGVKVRFQLYTVPGQVKYKKTRKLVLQAGVDVGVDAIVFVADSHTSRRDANIESFRDLQENLKEQGKRLEDLPLVYEFNKRDLKEILSIDHLNQDLNPQKLPFFPAVATRGVGVMETLEAISRMVLQDIEQRLSGAAIDAELDLSGGQEEKLESRPIGYDNTIQVEEFEIEPDAVAQTGTLKESQFFDLKEIEKQALRELDEFIEEGMRTRTKFGGYEGDDSLGEQPSEDTEKLPSFINFDSRIIRHLLSLPLSHTIPSTPSRPAFWLRGLGALNIPLPLCFAQDLGTVLTRPHEQLFVQRPEYLPEDLDTSAYMNFLTHLTRHSLLKELSTWNLSDEVTGVILAKMVAGVQFPEAWAIPGGVEAVLFARELAGRLDQIDPARLWRDIDPVQRPDLGQLLPPQAMAQIESNVRQLDVNELRFLHCYGSRFVGAPDPRDLLDLFTLLDLPPTAKLALSQVLRLLPSISEAVSTGGVQTYAMGGYEGLTHKGSLDSLLPTELAYPDAMFFHRLLNQEALYYGREGQRERQKELAYIVTQAGLELLGDGEVLAKGVTLALAQTMQRRGYEVKQSFVGSACTLPNSLNRPTDVQRILYYRDPNALHAQDMLTAITGYLRCFQELYRGIYVFWVVDEYWDADEWTSHDNLYRELRQISGQQAWFIHVGMGDRKINKEHLAVAKQFHRYHVVNSELMWREESKEILSNFEDKYEHKLILTRDIKARIILRSEPLMVSRGECNKLFGLDKDLRPLEYIENNFEDHGDTVMDHATGLMWQKSGTGNTVMYEEVQTYVDRLNREQFANYDDWRLPTSEELLSLLEPTQQSNELYINPVFDKKQWCCWSSDKHPSGDTWNIYFINGQIHWSGLDSNFIRAVRTF